MKIEIREINFDSPLYIQEKELRDRVMRRPLGLQLTEDDTARDHLQIHIGLFVDDVLNGCVLLEPLGTDIVKMRQVAVEQNFQGMGLGKKLIQFAEKEAASRGFKKIVLLARETVLKFYLDQGYIPTGPVIQTVKIPHQPMEKVIESSSSLKELWSTFLKLGVTAFGGPVAHIALMQNLCVKEKRWLSNEKFLQLVAMTNLIPGPNSTEMAMQIGFFRGRWAGLYLSGLAFILPAFSLVWILSFLYLKLDYLPMVKSLFQMVAPVILSIVVQAIYHLGSSVKLSLINVSSFVLSMAVYWYTKSEITTLLASAVFFGFFDKIKKWTLNLRSQLNLKSLSLGYLFFLNYVTSAAAEQANTAVGLARDLKTQEIFFSFIKIGSVLYGSGYVLISFLKSEFVDRLGAIDNQQLLDAIAIGQFTPGPLFTSATFLGYLMKGSWGAIAATAGIFLPAFIFVSASVYLHGKLESIRWFRQATLGLQISSLALMVVAAARFACQYEWNFVASIIGIVSLVVLLKSKINSVWLVLIAGVVGLIRNALLT